MPANSSALVMVVPPGRDHPAADDPGLGIADEHGGEHVHLGVPQGLQGHGADVLPLSADVLRHAADGLRGRSFQNDVAGPGQIVLSLVARRVVEADDEVRRGRRPKPPFDGSPGGHEVAQADDGEVVHQGGPQDGRAAEDRGHAGDGHHRHTGVLRRKLLAKAAHAVDPGVAAADHSHGLALRRLGECQLHPLHLPAHGGGQKGLVRETVLHQVHVDRVAHPLKKMGANIWQRNG